MLRIFHRVCRRFFIWSSGKGDEQVLPGNGNRPAPVSACCANLHIHVLLDGLSYIAVIGSLLALKLETKPEPPVRHHLVHGMTFMGAMPAGALLFGQSASMFGAPATIRVGGLCCVAAGLAFGLRLPALRAVARPVYIERGILPRMVEGSE